MTTARKRASWFLVALWMLAGYFLIAGIMGYSRASR